MEAILAVCLMIVILEFRESRWSSRFKELESTIEQNVMEYGVATGSIFDQVEATKKESLQLSEDVRNLRVTIESLRNEQSNLVKEYDLRLRIGNIDEGQAIDGVMGL